MTGSKRFIYSILSLNAIQNIKWQYLFQRVNIREAKYIKTAAVVYNFVQWYFRDQLDSWNAYGCFLASNLLGYIIAFFFFKLLHKLAVLPDSYTDCSY